MGLDQYLYAEHYIASFVPRYNVTVSLTKNGAAIDIPGEPKYLVTEVGYWRKANEIHRWFCQLDDGRDECQRIYVTRDNLRNLLDIVNEVLADPDKGPDKLPTQSGFFFGSTDYDEYYIEDLQETKRIIEDALKIDDDWTFYYQASW